MVLIVAIQAAVTMSSRLAEKLKKLVRWGSCHGMRVLATQPAGRCVPCTHPSQLRTAAPIITVTHLPMNCTQGLSAEDAPSPASAPAKTKDATKKKPHLTFRIYFPLPPFDTSIHFNALKAGHGTFNFTGALLGPGGKILQSVKQQSNARVELVNARGNLHGLHPGWCSTHQTVCCRLSSSAASSSQVACRRWPACTGAGRAHARVRLPAVRPPCMHARSLGRAPACAHQC